jgi:hypothetical protein
MVRNLIEEVGTCVTRLEFQHSQHWPVRGIKVYSNWTLLVEQDPPSGIDAISMKFGCAVPCFGKFNTIVNVYTGT